MGWVAQCPDDLVGADYLGRLVAAVVEKLDISGFSKAIKAREGVAGRDTTDPRLLIALWLYACIRGIGSACEVARRYLESAPFQWLCGGVTVNHRMLSDFRTDHGTALDELFTQLVASLVGKGLVRVSRLSQDGVRVRVNARADSFRCEDRLRDVLEQARQHVEQLRTQIDGPAQAGVTARQRAMRKHAAEDKLQRLEQAVVQLPELKRRHAEAMRQAGQGKSREKLCARQPRVSATDPEVSCPEKTQPVETGVLS
jgi:transposase